MNKRGQVYLLAALLLGLVIFGLMHQLNVVHINLFDDDFLEISENYNQESSRFVNYLVQGRLHDDFNLTTLIDNFSEFTVDFSSYAKTQNPYFGFIYLFDVSNQTNTFFIGDYLDQDIIVYVNTDTDNSKILNGCHSLIQAGASFDSFGIDNGISFVDLNQCVFLWEIGSTGSYNITFIIGDVSYSVSPLFEIPEIVIVGNAYKDNQRKVFVNDHLIFGNRVDIQSFCDLLPSETSGSTEICDCVERLTEDKCERLNSLGCVWNGNGCVDA